MSVSLYQSKFKARAGPLTTPPFKAAVVVVAASLASCSDTSQTTTPPAGRSAEKAHLSVGTAAALPASTLSFDVSVQRTSSASPSQSFSWHIERDRVGPVGWRTTVTIHDDPRIAHIPRASWRPMQFLIDENGHLAIHRADGGVATLLNPSQEPIASLVARANLPRPSFAANALPTLNTGWLDGIVMTAAGRAQEMAAAMHGGSPPIRDAGGLDHYAKRVGVNRVDFGIDPLASVVATLIVSGPSASHEAVHNYMSDPSGNSIRWRTQIKDTDARLSRSTTILLSNVLIDGHEVKP